MRIAYFLAGIITGAFFLSVHQPMLLLFSLFLVSCAFGDVLRKLGTSIALPAIIKFIVVAALVGVLTEALAILNNAGMTTSQVVSLNRLFSPAPWMDIVLGLGYYVPLAVVWFFLMKRFDYQVKDAFVAMGIFGIFSEGGGLVLLSLNTLMWAYAFAVHGSYMGIPAVIFAEDQAFAGRSRAPRAKKILYGVAWSLLAFVAYTAWAALVARLGLDVSGCGGTLLLVLLAASCLILYAYARYKIHP